MTGFTEDPCQVHSVSSKRIKRCVKATDCGGQDRAVVVAGHHRQHFVACLSDVEKSVATATDQNAGEALKIVPSCIIKSLTTRAWGSLEMC